MSLSSDELQELDRQLEQPSVSALVNLHQAINPSATLEDSFAIVGPTKGLQMWTILLGGATVSFTLGEDRYTRSESDNLSPSPLHVEFSFFSGHADLEIAIPSVGFTNHWTVAAGVIFGGLTTDIPPEPTNKTQFVTGGFSVSIGIFEALGKDKMHQLYVNVVPVYDSWMSKLPGSTPFWALCLPGSHDAGSNTTEALDIIANSPSALGALSVLLTVLAGYASKKAITTMIWLGGLTQHDNIASQLRMGIRWFDFRPGYAPPGLRSVVPDIRHIHSILPGQKWEESLNEILTFLASHPSEIVVISRTTSGFPPSIASGMILSDNELALCITRARQVSNVTEAQVGIGSPSDVLRRSLDDIRRTNKRLIISEGNSTFSSLDAYNDNIWGTLEPAKLDDAYTNKLTAENQNGRTQTVFQCQGTATSADTKSVVGANIQNLPLLGTKGHFNAYLLPRIRDGHQKRLNRKQHLVLMDDWADGSLTSVAIDITNDRLSRLDSFVDDNAA